MSKWKKVALWKKILIGVVIGLIIGLVSPKAAEVISPLGDIFLRMLKMLIVPLVFFSITSGVCKMGDVKQLRTVGIRYVLWIMASAVIAAICGVIGGLIVQPGRGTTEFLAAAEAAEAQSYSFIDNVISWFPTNIVESMANANMLQIIVELIKLASLIITLNKSVACAERVSGVLAVPTTMNYPAKGGAAKKVTGDAAVTFKNVSFTYAGAGAESLSDISFTAKRGQTIGIIGGTGSGKSTLVSLISRFYDATSGDVMVDGENVKNYTKEELCNKVGVVQQRAVLFKGSIRDNMKWGKEDAADAEIWEALTTAQAKEVVEGKQDQLDFMLEQNGKNLSGGQKQRLSIARALVKKPEILILDDSSSALDFATDAKLRKAVHNLEGNTTTFLVSQRIAGIRQADQILVLGNGTLEGNGTHDELMKTCEVYREIYFSQFPEERAAYNNESGVIA